MLPHAGRHTRFDTPNMHASHLPSSQPAHHTTAATKEPAPITLGCGCIQAGSVQATSCAVSFQGAKASSNNRLASR